MKNNKEHLELSEIEREKQGFVEPLIELHHIDKSYYNKTVLKNISLQLFPGKFYSLLGHNGAGKSTLLKILSGQEFFNSGQGFIYGKDIKSDWGNLKQKISLVTEQINYELPVTFREFSKVYSKIYPKWDQDLFDKIVKERNLDIDKMFNEYSRGQKMQLALILALSSKPDIYFIDEVTSVLDVYARKFYIDILNKEVKKGATVVMTSNIISELENYSSDIILITDGELKIDESLEKISETVVKVRQTHTNKKHIIFESPYCFWVGTNSDRSKSYLIRKNIFDDLAKKRTDLLDRRKITLEELFQFYTADYLKSLEKKIKEVA